MKHLLQQLPESEHKRARLKNLWILAGSSLYDPETIQQQLLERENILKFELAIIDGTVSKLRSVLEILVHLRDSTHSTLLQSRKYHSTESNTIDWDRQWSTGLGRNSVSLPFNGKNATDPTSMTRIRSVNEE